MRFQASGLYISVIPVVVLGTFIGFAGTLLGIGGGFILVPALIYLFRVPTAVVVGTIAVPDPLHHAGGDDAACG